MQKKSLPSNLFPYLYSLWEVLRRPGWGLSSRPGIHEKGTDLTPRSARLQSAPLIPSLPKDTKEVFTSPTLLLILKIVFIHESWREAETQAEGEAGPMQGARRGARSRVSRTMPQAAGGTKPLCHPAAPKLIIVEGGGCMHRRSLYSSLGIVR